MSRVVIKTGDVFKVRTLQGHAKYFQYIGFDNTQLGSPVICALAQTYAENEPADLSLVVQGRTDFYAHTMLKTGLKMGLWTKVGNAPIAPYTAPLFCHTYDYGRAAWQEPILISTNWVVWRMNEEMQRVGALVGENQRAEIGMVMSPNDIVHRMVHGEYDMPFYPAFK